MILAKLIKPHLLEYQNKHNNSITSVHYVLSQDVAKHHGLDFFAQWKKCVHNFEGLRISETQSATYYSDYKDAAYSILTEHI